MATRIGSKSYGPPSAQAGGPVPATGMAAQSDVEPDITDPQEAGEGEGEGAPAQAPIPGQQVSQQQANYRMGSPLTKCGNCVYYHIINGVRQFGRCTQVAGEISTYGVSDYFRKIQNPFPPVLTDEEANQLEQWYWQKADEKGISSSETTQPRVIPPTSDQQMQTRPVAQGQTAEANQ